MNFFKSAQPRLLEAACFSHVGRRRKNNEDNFCFDGMGGGDYGEVASYTAAKSACSFFAEQGRVEIHDVTESLREYCAEVNGDVFRAGNNLGTEQMR